MDSGTIGAIVTVVFFLLFIAIAWWAFSRKNKKRFDEAAHLPFEEDDDKPGADNGRTQ
jgi:cytochrome c oxidase cbb3-type subunit IV